MDTNAILQPVAQLGNKVLWFGIGLVVLGGLAVYSPEMSGMTVAVVVGVALIIGGILRTLFAWLSAGWGSLFLRLAVGIMTIIAGGYMIANPDQGAQALAVVLVIYLFADGITTLLFAFRLPPAAGGIWVMVGALASIGAGVLMWMHWPITGDLAIGVLIGIKLILDGISLIGVGSAAKSAVT